MPPDVLLVLASSGITLVASLMFFVSDDPPPPETDGPLVDFCLPPLRTRRPAAKPPPLPAPRHDHSVRIAAPELHGTLSLTPSGNEWVVTLDVGPLADAPAVRATDGMGAVHDLRWNVQAGIPKAVRRQWRLKPGRA